MSRNNEGLDRQLQLLEKLLEGRDFKKNLASLVSQFLGSQNEQLGLDFKEKLLKADIEYNNGFVKTACQIFDRMIRNESSHRHLTLTDQPGGLGDSHTDADEGRFFSDEGAEPIEMDDDENRGYMQVRAEEETPSSGVRVSPPASQNVTALVPGGKLQR